MLLSVVSPYVTPAHAQYSTTSIDSELQQTRQALAELNKQIQKVDQAIADNQKMIDDTAAQISTSEKQLAALQAEIQETEERIAARNEILKERARSLQVDGGSISYINVIFGATSFTDFINRVTAVTTILNADQTLIEEHTNDIQSVKDKQETVKAELAKLEDTKVELEGMQAQIQEQKAQNDALKADLKLQEKGQLAERDRLIAASRPVVTPAVPSNTNNNAAASIPTSTPKASGSVNTVITAGYKYIGNSVYVFGGGRSAYDIANGRFDCSGYVHWAFAQAGVSVGASTDALKNQGTTVAVSDMQPGDLVFFDTYKKDGHVGIYIGGGKFIGSQTSTGVAIASMTSGYWKGVFNGRVKRVM